MKLLQLSPTDTKGGASKVAFDLGRGLVSRGHQVELHVSKKFSPEEFVRELPPVEQNNRLSQKIIHRLGINPLNLNGRFPFSLGRSFFTRFDVIHIHDLPAGFNLAALPWLCQMRPVVWTLHSMWPFTGGCIYSYECTKWQRACHKCPQFGKFPLMWLHRDGSWLHFQLKKLVYSRSRLTIVGPCNWIVQLARESILRRFPIYRIHYPVDTNVFKPLDRIAAKQTLGIPANAKTIMFAIASNPLDKRKGVEVIERALPLLGTKEIFLMPTGIASTPKALETRLHRYPSLPPRHVDDPNLLNLYYNAADVLWHPSLADNSPVTILEALSAGTVVVASNVGGVPEMLNHGINGLLFPSGQAQELAALTHKVLFDDNWANQLREAATESVRERHSPDRFVAEHEALYRQISTDQSER